MFDWMIARFRRFLAGLISPEREWVVFYFGRGVDERLSVLTKSGKTSLRALQLDAGFKFAISPADIRGAILSLSDFLEHNTGQCCLFLAPDPRYAVTLHRVSGEIYVSWTEVDYRFKYTVVAEDCSLALAQLKIALENTRPFAISSTVK